MEMNATVQLSEIEPPAGITLLDDPDATVLASITPPSVSTETTDEVETETGVVGRAAPAAEAEAEGEAAGGDDAAGDAESAE
jgi:large subunit ribosomal protein L25